MSLPLSTLITNPVSGWIVAHSDWRWLPLISDSPEQARWISKEEREYLVETLHKEKVERQTAFTLAAPGGWTYKNLFSDKNLWLMVLLFICYTSGQYGYSIWLPTLVKNLTG